MKCWDVFFFYLKLLHCNYLSDFFDIMPYRLLELCTCVCAVPQCSCTSLDCDSSCGTVTRITSFSWTLVMAALYFSTVLLAFGQKVLVLHHFSFRISETISPFQIRNCIMGFFPHILYWHGVIQMVFLMFSNKRWQSSKMPMSNSSGNVGAVCWNVSHERTWSCICDPR